MARIENSVESLREIFDLMAEKGVKSLLLQDKDIDIHIEMDCEKAPVIMGSAMPQYQQAAPAQQTKPEAAKPQGNIVKAPIVGTFYASASPDDKPFATVGQTVKKGDVLFIIESMKVMNEVKSEFDGVVTIINVKNGEAVEYDQPLMIIE